MPQRPIFGKDVVVSALASLRARRWAVLVGAVLALVLLAVVLARPGSYDARRTLAFTSSNVVESVFDDPQQAEAPPTAAELSSDPVLGRLQAMVGRSGHALRSYLSVEQGGGQERQADLVARASTPAEADALVDAWTRAYIGYRQAAQATLLDAARERVDAEAARLGRSSSSAQRRAVVRERLRLAAADVHPPEVEEVARTTTQASGPSAAVAVAGALLVFVLVCLAAVVTDRGVRTGRVAEWAAGLPVLGEVARSGATGGLARELAAYGEPGNARTVVVVTGPAGGRSVATLAATTLAEDRAKAGLQSLLLIAERDAGDEEATPDRDARVIPPDGQTGPGRAGGEVEVRRLGSREPRSLAGALEATTAWDAVVVALDEPDPPEARLLQGLGATWIVAFERSTTLRSLSNAVHGEVDGGPRPAGLVLVADELRDLSWSAPAARAAAAPEVGASPA